MSIPTLVDGPTITEIFDKIIENAEEGIVIVEIGVFVGGTVCYFHDKLKAKGLSKYTIVGIDNFKFANIHHNDNVQYTGNVQPYMAYSNNIRKAGASPVTIIGDSIKISSLFKDNTIDFLYIDGDHSDYCIKELECWLPKLKTDSVIAGHDYDGSEHVRKACKKHLKVYQTTSTKSSYYKIIGEGINKKKEEKPVKNKTLIRLLFWLYGWYHWVTSFWSKK